MASAPCRRPVAPISEPPAEITLAAVAETITLLSDLEALCEEGLVRQFTDGFGVERFCPFAREIQR